MVTVTIVGDDKIELVIETIVQLLNHGIKKV